MEKEITNIKKISDLFLIKTEFVASILVILVIIRRGIDIKEIIGIEGQREWRGTKTIITIKDFLEKIKKYFDESDTDTALYVSISVLLNDNSNDKVFNRVIQILVSEKESFEEIGKNSNILDNIIEESFEQDFKTPSWLNKLAVEMLNPIKGNIYDGVAGCGGSLLEAYRYSKSKNGNIYIYSQEKEELLMNILELRAYLEGVEGSFNTYGDTIGDPHVYNEESDAMDYSIMFPPLGDNKNIIRNDIENIAIWRNIFNEFRIEQNIIKSDWLFVFHQIAMLNKSGKSIIWIFSNLLFKENQEYMRTKLVGTNAVECIISFPANSLSFTAVPFSMIILNKKNRNKNNILMIDAQKLMMTEGNVSNRKRYVLTDEGRGIIKKIYEKFEELAEISKVVDKKNLKDHILLPNTYVKGANIETEDFGTLKISELLVNKKDQWNILGELVEISNGLNISKYAEKNDLGNVKIVKLSDVQNGELCLDLLDSYFVSENVGLDKYKIQKDDIIIAAKGEAPKICLIEDIPNNIFVSSSFLILRCKKDNIEPLYLKYYLESPLGLYNIKNRQASSSIVMLNASSLKNIPIPKNDLIIQKECSEYLKDEESKIKEGIEQLKIEAKICKWNYYEKIGISEFMNNI